MNQILLMLCLCCATASKLNAQPTSKWQAQKPSDPSSLTQDANIIDARLRLIGQERSINVDTILGVFSISGSISPEEKEALSVIMSEGNVKISEVGDRTRLLKKLLIHEHIFYFLDTNNVMMHHAPRFPSHVVGECSASSISQVNRELQSELGGMTYMDWHLAWTKADNGFYHLLVMKNNANMWSLNDHVLSTSIVQNTGYPSLLVEFDAKGAEMLANLTASNKGRVLALHMNDQVIMAPRVQDQIRAGKIEISTRSGEGIELLSALLDTERLSNTYLETE